MSSLETSVTLEDVFTVVEAKRVPLAPELAGYLSLEIADGTDAGSGDVDPKTVFISEEGTVALVRPKRDVVTGDAEASVRALLTKLLEASGSGTPALTTAAKRKPGNGLPALVEELEAALIPVNRAAGRRALARLAREVKRVLLGVGRNASVPPVLKEAAPKAAPHARPVIVRKKAAPAGPTDDAAAKPDAPKPTDGAPERRELPVRARARTFDEEPATAKRANELSELASSMNHVDAASEPNDAGAAAPGPPTPEAPAASPRAPVAPSPAPAVAAPKPAGPPPLPKRESPAAPAVAAASEPEPAPAAPEPPLFGRDDVDSLLASFAVSAGQEEKQMARELKAMAGLSPTPPPPDATTLAELTKDIGKDLPKQLVTRDVGKDLLDLPKPGAPSVDGDSVEALLALADASGPVPAVGASHPAPLPEPPKVAPPPPVAAPANLPPSPLFGSPPVPSAAAGNVPGAPAALRQSGSDVTAGVPRADSSRDVVAKAADSARAEPSKRGADKGTKAKAGDPLGPTTGRRPRAGDRQPRAPKTGMAMLIFALVVLAGGTAAIWKFAPHVFTGKKKPVATATASAPPVAPAPCKVALVLTDVPAGAEILLRMGQAPVDVERMPVGTRLELIATAEGYAPRRAVIKADDVWNPGPDGKPRIEVPIQLDPSKAKPGAVDPWPPAEPGSQVGGSGAPGTVHVVSNVRGAEVWLLAGLGPEARIDQLRCDADIDVLFAGPPNLRKRLHVSEAEIEAAAADPKGNKVVTVSAK